MNSWVLRGKIVQGFQKGGTLLGFPTANIELDETCISALQKFFNTVWTGFAMIEDENVPGDDIIDPSVCTPGVRRVAAVATPSSSWQFVDSVGAATAGAGNNKKAPTAVHFVYPTVLSVGNNPHFKNVAITVEPYIVHKFLHDFYGRHIRIIAVQKIRDMVAFTTLDQLITQIKDDCRIGTALLQTPQALRIREALVDPRVWADAAPPPSIVTAEQEQAPPTLPGVLSDRPFWRMLVSAAAGEERQPGASQL